MPLQRGHIRAAVSVPERSWFIFSLGHVQRQSQQIAVEGCCHGELDAIYSHVNHLENRHNYKVDALLICGDFQAMRNKEDVGNMACPTKYKVLGGFHRYYTGQKKAPMLTIVIGGNHEASNYMWELYHGGWLAPNIYFLGHAGCIQLNGIRIAGISGIYNENHYNLGNYERLPLDPRTMRSIYHTREYNINRLSLLSPPSIFLSHDWPQGIEQYGDTDGLLKKSPHFQHDIQDNTLGSPPLLHLMKTLKPEWWFSGHMHVKFEATYPHEKSTTKFLALDKCLKGREFLEVIQFPVASCPVPNPKPKLTLSYDPEWLAITRVSNPYLSRRKIQWPFPGADDARQRVARELEWVTAAFPKPEDLEVERVQQFVKTVYGPTGKGWARQVSREDGNPQTVAFCEALEIENRIRD
ncbi:uncharacterized protein LACBIDRAFT_186329 [Laccaria bicolor S238N-H82]|uniref:Predicted protein n=1 Tax=Laccaria bicolor (strain S238N-H82 / ATCC MYA-4686) TaxID=486041 RepID=B0DX22_LACBS|nr:uncharacterized protein LACBIDRAFT_186329 [Laccaria bicolor S238N-H82]EDR00916.1 predicted protein [Laccaria bicolor S238N-H82]|eukprot:XP_001888510.1 predicted protein [Laccaria bicolor S238N-H82]